MIKTLVYKLRFKFYLWRHCPGMSLLYALRYPTDISIGVGDPIEDAQEEMSCMTE